ncbi:MAG: hypothetical protein ACXWKY_10530 [Caulobacteraceae bacterium]
MNLVDRYVAAIGRELPPKIATEIAAELKDVLLSKIEDRESELGRPMTDKEIEQMLLDFGHPMIVAGGYRKTQYLIGPELFPMWVATMRMVLMIGGAIALVGFVVNAAATNSTPVAALQRALQAFWPLFIWVFGVVTLVFAFNERMGKYQFKLNWTPRQLPPVRSRGRKRFNLMAEIGMGLVVLLWWTGLLRFRAWLPAPPAIDVHLAATWAPFYVPVIVYILAEIAIDLLALARPGWGRLNAGLSLAKYAAACLLVSLILTAGHWVEVLVPGPPPHAVEVMVRGFDRWIQVALSFSFVVFAIKGAVEAWRLFRLREDDGGQAGNGASAIAGAR